jgi:hypothetical protein
MIPAIKIPKQKPYPSQYFGACSCKKIFYPIAPPRLPMEMSRAIPTERFQVGARLLPTQLRISMMGGYTPAGMAKRKA